MYLSRVAIDSQNRKKIRDLTHLGAYHNWVESSFPDERLTGERSRKLWRIDQLNGTTYLLIVSPEKPNLTLLEKYGVPGSAAVKDYAPFLNKIQSGNAYRFRATLNPVHSLAPQVPGERGRVVPEITEKYQLEYLKRKAQKCGFHLIDGNYGITERGYEVLRKSGCKPLRLNKTTFEGMLIVDDEEVFRNALTQGIGRKKAYGFGMMTVIPVKEH